MAGELEAVVREMLDALAKMDRKRLLQSVGSDAQGVDEISRRWMRGSTAIADHLEQLSEMVSEVDSELRDVQERVWGDVGLVTCWLEQDYTLDGERQHISAPTTVVLRRENGDWRVALVHSVPLPAEE